MTQSTLPSGDTSTRINDAMAVLQSKKLAPPVLTFADLASQLFAGITQNVSPEGRVDWIIDTYPEVSIMDVEGDKRNAAATGVLETRITSANQKVGKQFRKSLRSGKFKTESTQFLLKQWSTDEYAEKIGQKQ